MKGGDLKMRIGFVGKDGRTLLSALVVSTAKSQKFFDEFEGVVIGGNSAMDWFAKKFEWPVRIIPIGNNSLENYAKTIIEAFRETRIDYLMIMPEALLFDGLVDWLEKAGFGERIIGLTSKGALVEGDKIFCKKFCKKYSISVADEWTVVDAKNYKEVLEVCLKFLDRWGGGVLKYPYSAGGKGSRIILDPWQIREVYERLISDYKESYKKICGDRDWPLLIESRMSGVEISFTTLVDKNGNFQILPTAMDYPERFEGVASKDNPITGGMGSISPHPMESPDLIEMAKKEIFEPFVNALKEEGLLRPTVLYPGCIVSLDNKMKPRRIRMCEMNVRPGEPEFQPVVRRVRNLGVLIKAMVDGNLNEVEPEVRENQISISLPLVTGPGGPQGQKGYPWSYTKGESIEIDFDYLKKKRIQIIPSAMTYSQGLKSDGSRVAYLNANAEIKETRSEVARKVIKKLLAAFDQGKIRVLPKENPLGNRLEIRRDVGKAYILKEKVFDI